METWKAINGVRVVREFDARPIAPEHLDRILNAGRRAGSSKNQQHWAFIVIGDRQRLRDLAAVGRYAGHLAGATVAVALVTPDESGHRNNSVMWDLGRAAQNMVLAAWELGIGSVPATVYDHDMASRILGLPADRRCDFLLSFGHPSDPSVLSAPNRAGGRLTPASGFSGVRWSPSGARRDGHAAARLPDCSSTAPSHPPSSPGPPRPTTVSAGRRFRQPMIAGR